MNPFIVGLMFVLWGIGALCGILAYLEKSDDDRGGFLLLVTIVSIVGAIFATIYASDSWEKLHPHGEHIVFKA